MPIPPIGEAISVLGETIPDHQATLDSQREGSELNTSDCWTERVCLIQHNSFSVHTGIDTGLKNPIQSSCLRGSSLFVMSELDSDEVIFDSEEFVSPDSKTTLFSEFGERSILIARKMWRRVRDRRL
jgi:hypothetical protein